MSKCEAITLANKKCRRASLRNEKYCSQHQRIIIECVDVEQAGAVNYSPEEDGPGLLEEIWKLIGERLCLLDLRRLYLTCKTLFRLFTFEGQWFKHHPRYLHIEVKGKIWIGPQDETTKSLNNEQLGRLCKAPLGPHLLTLMVCRKMVCSLTSVNSYVAAREIFRLLARTSKEMPLAVGTSTYIRDIAKSQIEAYSFEMPLLQAEILIPPLVCNEGVIAVIFGGPLQDQKEFLGAFSKHMEGVSSCNMTIVDENIRGFLFTRKETPPPLRRRKGARR